MAVGKRRSDIQKLVTASRDIWRQSQTYQSVKKSAKVSDKHGYWYVCQSCRRECEAPKVDHIKPIGSQPDFMHEFGEWLEKLFCSWDRLQVLCQECHTSKTKIDKKRVRDALKTSQDSI